MREVIVVILNLSTILLVSEVQCDIQTIHLDSSHGAAWTLRNQNGSVNVAGTVPGGVYSDLMKAGVIGDILAGFNDVLTRWVAYDTWTYTGRFHVADELLESPAARLFLHGVDTIAFIELNGVPLLSTNNMFLRYMVDVKGKLKSGQNELKVTFVPPVEAARNRSSQHFAAPDCVPDEYNGECHVNQLRKMQASFGWDWGPAFPSVGLWKSAEIVFYDNAIIRVVTAQTKKKDAVWILKLKTYLESSQKGRNITVRIEARIQVEGGQSMTAVRDFDVTTAADGTAMVEFDMNLSENVIRVWWPNAYGRQPLYDLDVELTTPGNEEVSKKHLRIGFRIVESVEVDASTILDNSPGAEGLTFYFNVNGYPLFMKGSNWIPSHVLPEYSYNRSRIDDLLLSAKEAHMSMLRVWGGGLYEDEYFYERCDELGILIWQDFPFACSMYPADPEFLDNVKAEIEQNVIYLQSHPSIVLWAGNNENEAALIGNWYGTRPQYDKYKEEYIKLYVETIRPIVEILDGNGYAVSSPSNGLKSEMDGYVSQNPYDPHYGDTHYYNYLADNWDFNIYPKTRFASEYGFQSMPSLSTMRQATQTSSDYSLKSAYSRHRQHSPNGYSYIDSQINKHLKIDKNDPNHFDKFVYYSQITQAMAMKTETEFYRQSQSDWFTMGALYWQLNDIWQAPSWSAIEYGGKWKMLHYFSKSFFAPVLVSPRLLASGDVDVYLINDRFVPILDARIVVDVFNFSSLTPIVTHTYSGYASALSSVKQNFTVELWNRPSYEIFLRFSLQADGVPYSPFNFVFPKPLKFVKGLEEPTIQIHVAKKLKKVINEYRYHVTVRVNRVVLFLWLEADDVPGRFRDNGLIVTRPVFAVTFVSAQHIDASVLEKKITYKYYVN